jgi:carboxypeptidase C (cathepsin A)
MHSGYVNVTASDHLFYWHFAAQSDEDAKAPIVLWSNGGPGCSAMEGTSLVSIKFCME